jgi:hypothetical protein
MRRRIVLCALVFAGLAAGCSSPRPRVYQPPPLTPAEREEIQTRILRCDLDIAFASLIAVLQDEQWDLQDIKKESGVIQALTKRRTDVIGPGEDWRADQDPRYRDTKKAPAEAAINEWTRWEKLTAHIEPWGEGKVRIRIAIAKHGILPPVTYSYPVSSGREVMVNAPAREDQVVVEEPLAYSRLFTRVQKAVDEREAARERRAP